MNRKQPHSRDRRFKDVLTTKSEKTRLWRLENPEKLRAQRERFNHKLMNDPARKRAQNKNSVKHNRRKKLETLLVYCDGLICCACCGESEIEFLTFDHIDGGGAEHRRAEGIKGPMQTWLIKNNYPPGFRVLCFNCNCAFGFYGYCPHTVDVDKAIDWVDYL